MACWAVEEEENSPPYTAEDLVLYVAEATITLRYIARNTVWSKRTGLLYVDIE